MSRSSSQRLPLKYWLIATWLLLLLTCGIMVQYEYNRGDLMDISNHGNVHVYEDIASLTKLGICNFPTLTGCRGSKYKNSIPMIISNRTEQPVYQEVHVHMNKYTLEVLVVYHRPPNKRNKETSTSIWMIQRMQVPVVSRICYKRLTSISMSKRATHMNNHTLGLVLSQSMGELVNGPCICGTTVSDNFLVEFTLPRPNPGTMKKEITFCKIKAIDTT